MQIHNYNILREVTQLITSKPSLAVHIKLLDYANPLLSARMAYYISGNEKGYLKSAGGKITGVLTDLRKIENAKRPNVAETKRAATKMTRFSPFLFVAKTQKCLSS